METELKREELTQLTEKIEALNEEERLKLVVFLAMLKEKQ